MFTMINLRKQFLSFVIGWSLVFLAVLGFAQQSAKPPTDNQPASVSDSELRAFVKAYVENQKIRQEYEPPLSVMTDPKKYQQTQDQASAALKTSLAKQNLSIEDYNRIFNAINRDEQLRKQAMKLVEEERKRSS